MKIIGLEYRIEAGGQTIELGIVPLNLPSPAAFGNSGYGGGGGARLTLTAHTSDGDQNGRIEIPFKAEPIKEWVSYEGDSSEDQHGGYWSMRAPNADELEAAHRQLRHDAEAQQVGR